MPLRTDIITIHPVAPATPITPLEPAGDARQEAFQRSLAGLLGKQLQGEVLSRLTDGSFLVKVAGTPARLMLPAGAQVGTEVPLTLVTLSPRPTFQVGTGHGTERAVVFAEAGPALLPGPAGTAARATPLVYLDGAEARPGLAPPPAMASPLSAPLARTTSYAAALLAQAPNIPADQLPPIDPRAAPATLSETARALAGVLGAALKSPKPQTAIIARTPLLAAPARDPAQLASALGDAIGASGLFYESHLAEWSAGARPLAELAREPQMRGMAGASLLDAAGRLGLAAADPAIASFISLQLAAQEQSSVSWQGQIWPGQPMEWKISKDSPGRHGGDQDEADPAGWRSALRLRFAMLGEVGATLVLTDGRLQIQLEAPSEQVRELLRQHAAQLSGALEAAGIALSSFGIHAAGGADD